MYYLKNSTLLIQDETKKFVVLTTRIDYFSNEMNKNKYKSFQSIASTTENNVKAAEKQIVQVV